MTAVELTKAQGMALDTRVGEERRAEGAGAEAAQHAPGAFKGVERGDGMRKHERVARAIKAHFTLQAKCARLRADDRRFVSAAGSPALRQHVEPELTTARLNALSERTTVKQPAAQ